MVSFWFQETLIFYEGALGTHFEVTSQSKNLWIIRAYDSKRIGASFLSLQSEKRAA